METDPAGATIKLVPAMVLKADGSAGLLEQKDVAPDIRQLTTPGRVELKRNRIYRVTVEKEGFQAVQFDYRAFFDGLNLLQIAAPGGSAMMAADRGTAADSAFFVLKPIKLQKPTGPATAPVVYKEWRGRLLDETQYKEAMEAEHERAGMIGN